MRRLVVDLMALVLALVLVGCASKPAAPNGKARTVTLELVPMEVEVVE